MMKFVTHAELHEELMQQPGFKEAYDALEVEFALRSAIIKNRIEKGVTQDVLAKRMGTKQSAIARFESGRANPTFDFIQRLSRALGLKLTITVQ
ncbi:helix-turn-helix transcriptional regulator [soil metagenome]